jgi:RNA polymerase sigma-70 factor (ECF subfamily)
MPGDDPTPDDPFPTTRWCRVAAAGDPADPDSRRALEDLCSAYWYPVYAHIRRRGYEPQDALDLTQDYFARHLEGRALLRAADPARGRFRALLKTDCGFFLAHEAERRRTLRRGGGAPALSIDARDAEGRYLREPADPGLTPDRLFDRAWAIGLLGDVLDRLAREHAAAGQSDRFEALRPTLEGGRDTPHADIAARLGTTVAAVEAAARRLRHRYREVLRQQIAATLEDPADEAVDEEIRALFAALGG